MNTTQSMTFIKETGTLTAEASKLEPGTLAYRSTLLRTPHNIFIKSHYTGNIVEFMFHKSKADADGDTICWTFLAVDSKNINVRKLVIFND